MMRKFWIPIVIFIVSVMPVIGLIRTGMPVTHDGRDQVVRVANFYASLAEGNLIPRWGANLNWGYGHPVLMFLYPLPSYFASVFKLIGFTFVDSVKIVFAAAYVSSVIFMYLWVSHGWGAPAGILASVFYGFMPYRFVDLYVRGALGEHMSFVFPPLTAYLLLQLQQLSAEKNHRKNKLKIYGTTAGAAITIALLILSHNALSIIFLSAIILYISYLALISVPGRRIFILLAITVCTAGLGLSAFFWLPAFMEGKYTLRDVVTQGEAMSRFVDWKSFVTASWNYGGSDEFSKKIGSTVIAGIMMTVIGFNRLTRHNRFFAAGLTGIFLFSIYIQTESSAFIWERIGLLQKFQFPWRFLSLTVLSGSVLAAISWDQVIRLIRHVRLRKAVYIMVITASIAFTVDMWQPKDFEIKPESYYSGIYAGTTDTGESSPIWSVRFMEKSPVMPYEVTEGIAKIYPLTRTTTNHSYAVNTDMPVRVIEQTLYFPGWIVLVDGRPTEIEFQDPQYRGLITFRIGEGKHFYRVEFTDTKLRKFSEIISLGFLLSGLAGYVFIYLKNRSFSKNRTCP